VFDDDPRHTIEEQSPNAASLDGAGNVEVVDESTPRRVGVEYDMGEADRVMPMLRKQGEAGAGAVQALGPDRQPIRVQVAVEVPVRVRAPVVATPAVRVKLRDVSCVGGLAQPYLDFSGNTHDPFRIDTGVVTAPQGGAGSWSARSLVTPSSRGRGPLAAARMVCF